MKILVKLMQWLFDVARGVVATVLGLAAIISALLAHFKFADFPPMYVGALLLFVLAIVLYPRDGRKRRAKNAPRYRDISDLANAVEEKSVDLDKNLLSIFKGLRDDIENASDEVHGNPDQAVEQLQDISFELTRIVGDDEM